MILTTLRTLSHKSRTFSGITIDTNLPILTHIWVKMFFSNRAYWSRISQEMLLRTQTKSKRALGELPQSSTNIAENDTKMGTENESSKKKQQATNVSVAFHPR